MNLLDNLVLFPVKGKVFGLDPGWINGGSLTTVDELYKFDESRTKPKSPKCKKCNCLQPD